MLPKGCLATRRPDYVFRLEYVAEHEARFQELATPHGTFHAFHGSSVERFHSILHNGLLNMFNKVLHLCVGNTSLTFWLNSISFALNISPVSTSSNSISVNYFYLKNSSSLPLAEMDHFIHNYVCYMIISITVLCRRQLLGKALTYQLTWG